MRVLNRDFSNSQLTAAMLGGCLAMSWLGASYGDDLSEAAHLVIVWAVGFGLLFFFGAVTFGVMFIKSLLPNHREREKGIREDDMHLRNRESDLHRKQRDLERKEDELARKEREIDRILERLRAKE